MKLPDYLKKFVEVFSSLPGIGPRQAIRLAFHFVSKGGGLANEAITALQEIEKVRLCRDCSFVHMNPEGLCDICRDADAGRRNKKIIAIVEKETDLISIENTGKFRGRYLILGDLRKKGILEQDQKLKLDNLKSFIKAFPQGGAGEPGKAEEIIIAVNPTSIGIVNSKVIADELKPFANKITKLGIGIPSGGEIEFADEDTLGEALEGRK